MPDPPPAWPPPDPEKLLEMAGGSLADGAQDLIEALLQSMQNQVTAIMSGVQAIYQAVPPPPALPAPIDAVQTLEQIAAAVSAAETSLNKQGLSIFSGTLEAELRVKLPGTDTGASAKLVLNINPTPQA